MARIAPSLLVTYYVHTSLLKCFVWRANSNSSYNWVNLGWVCAVARHGEEPHAAAAAAFVPRRRSLPPPNLWSGRVGLGWVRLGWVGLGSAGLSPVGSGRDRSGQVGSVQVV